MKTLAKLLLLTTLTLSSSAFAMKTIDLVDKAQMTEQQKMDLAQKLAEKKDWKGVFEIMYPLALEGNLQAQSNLGMLYNLGRGVDENKELAYWWFSEAAERGKFRLARLYEEGIGTQVNIGLAKLLYLEIMNTAKKEETKEIARQRLQRLSLY